MKVTTRLLRAVCGLLLSTRSVFFSQPLHVNAADAPSLEAGWTNPPTSARLRAYWWWLNGNVTKAAITRDLEEMKAKGFGGALICDADGASQDGNATVPHGPTFMTPAWRELYKHTLREANRLGLEMSLNIQSGWNLGGPMVKAEESAKKLVWSEFKATGPAKLAQALPKPKHKDAYYRDLFVVAYRTKTAPDMASNLVAKVSASSEQANHPASNVANGNAESFRVSNGTEPGNGPTRAKPEWLQWSFPTPTTIERFMVQGREGYGPRECELHASDDGKKFRTIKAFTANEKGATTITFDATRASHFRLVILSAFDPRFPQTPRNVQKVAAAFWCAVCR